jgi:hypothetical protein
VAASPAVVVEALKVEEIPAAEESAPPKKARKPATRSRRPRKTETAGGEN